LKIKPICYPCALNFALRTMNFIGEGGNIELMRKVTRGISDIRPELTPAHLGTLVNRIIREETGVEDPYKDEKKRENRIALEVYPLLKRYVERSNDRLLSALKISAVGNAIDLGVSGKIHLDFNEIEKELDFDFRVNRMTYFREKLLNSKSILLVADNAGEIIFDRILLEELKIKKFVAVKTGPVINDITIDEIDETGILETAEVIETGSDSLGIIFEEVSDTFKEIYNASDIVIAKGHANTETLIDEKREIFFLLRAKCEYVADYLGIKKFDYYFGTG